MAAHLAWLKQHEPKLPHACAVRTPNSDEYLTLGEAVHLRFVQPRALLDQARRRAAALVAPTAPESSSRTSEHMSTLVSESVQGEALRVSIPVEWTDTLGDLRVRIFAFGKQAPHVVPVTVRSGHFAQGAATIVVASERLITVPYLQAWVLRRSNVERTQQFEIMIPPRSILWTTRPTSINAMSGRML